MPAVDPARRLVLRRSVEDQFMARYYRYISADSHFESQPEQWTHRVPKQYRDRAPRRIKLANGHDGLCSRALVWFMAEPAFRWATSRNI